MSLIIAPCSNRKRPRPEVGAANLSPGALEAVGREWLGWLNSLPTKSAAEVYCGRSVRVAERAAKALGANLLFASAGLGWVSAKSQIPSYSMTVVAGNDSVLSRIDGREPAAAWWDWLTKNSIFSCDLSQAEGAGAGLLLVALPQSYLLMVEADLLGLPDQMRQRLRIIQRRGAIVPRLAPWTLTYDDRLEGAEGYAGTRSDFASRAARHFVEQVLVGCAEGAVGVQEAAVQIALSSLMPRVSRVGVRRTDDELKQIVDSYWDAAGGRTTRLLRILRDELGIACEQTRFARLIANMRVEREAFR